MMCGGRLRGRCRPHTSPRAARARATRSSAEMTISAAVTIGPRRGAGSAGAARPVHGPVIGCGRGGRPGRRRRRAEDSLSLFIRRIAARGADHRAASVSTIPPRPHLRAAVLAGRCTFFGGLEVPSPCRQLVLHGCEHEAVRGAGTWMRGRGSMTRRHGRRLRREPGFERPSFFRAGSPSISARIASRGPAGLSGCRPRPCARCPSLLDASLRRWSSPSFGVLLSRFRVGTMDLSGRRILCAGTFAPSAASRSRFARRRLVSESGMSRRPGVRKLRIIGPPSDGAKIGANVMPLWVNRRGSAGSASPPDPPPSPSGRCGSVWPRDIPALHPLRDDDRHCWPSRSRRRETTDLRLAASVEGQPRRHAGPFA